MRKKDCRFGNGMREGESGKGWERREKRRERSSVVDQVDKYRCWIEEKESMKRAKLRVLSVALISKAPSSELHRSLRLITLRLSSVKLPNEISDLCRSAGYPPSNANIPTWPLNQSVRTVFAKVEVVIVWKKVGRWDKGMCNRSILRDVMLGSTGRVKKSRVKALWKVGVVVRVFGLKKSLDLSLAMEDNEGAAGSSNLKCQRRILRLIVLVATNGSLQQNYQIQFNENVFRQRTLVSKANEQLDKETRCLSRLVSRTFPSNS